MAPPGNRRPGYSRRAQYGTFFGYVLAVIGAGLGVVLLIFSIGNASAFAGLRGAASDVMAPAGKAAAATRIETRSVFAIIGGYLTSGVHTARLEREVSEARVKLAEAAAVRNENARLKALLGLTRDDPRPIAVARLISSTSASTRRFATLAAGAEQGVMIGMPVRSPMGLVGRVLEVGAKSSRILLISDTESVVPIRRASDGIPAFATGRTDGTLQVRLINLGLNPLKPGDALVTSGSGGLYRPNIAIAVVARLTRDGAIAFPLSDPGSTEFVVVDPLWDQTAPLAAPSAPRTGTAVTPRGKPR